MLIGIHDYVKRLKGTGISEETAEVFVDILKENSELSLEHLATKGYIAEVKGNITEVKGNITEVKSEIHWLKWVAGITLSLVLAGLATTITLFTNLDGKIERMERRVDGVESRLDRIEQKLDQLLSR